MTAVLWILLVLFAGDLLFDMDATQRLVGIFLAVCGMGWSFRRYCWPWLSLREDPIDVALQVEQRHEIDSDIVAALQFADEPPRDSESNALRRRVVEQISQLPPHLDCERAVWDAPFARRNALLLATLVAAGGLVWQFGDHARAFAARVAFRPVGYPTGTRIDALHVNGQSVLSGETRRALREATVIEDSPVEFWIHASGVLPDAGRIELTSIDDGEVRSLRLVRSALEETPLGVAESIEFGGRAVPGQPASAANHTGSPSDVASGRAPSDRQLTAYHGKLDRLTKTTAYRVRLGDAGIANGLIRVLAAPIVELRGEIEPPAYVGRDRAAISPGAAQLTVLEGSNVDLRVHCLNKPLEAAWVTLVAGGESPVRIELRALDVDQREWGFGELPAGLRDIRNETGFEVQLADSDGVPLRQPMRGAIRIERDAPPSARIASLHAVVLPTAKPIVQYAVHDDFAIARLRMQLVLQRPAGDGGQYTTVGSESFDIRLPNRPQRDLPLEASFPLDVSNLSAVVGERFCITLAATDDRGRRTGQETTSDPIYWEVGSEAAVLETIAELDEQTEQRLTDIIQQQLEVRNTP